MLNYQSFDSLVQTLGYLLNKETKMQNIKRIKTRKCKKDIADTKKRNNSDSLLHDTEHCKRADISHHCAAELRNKLYLPRKTANECEYLCSFSDIQQYSSSCNCTHVAM